MRSTAIVLIALLSLPACAGLQQASTGSISQVAPDTINAAKKALTAAHELHRATADFLTIAANTNLCHANCASRAKLYLDQSESALLAADKLVAVGDAVGIEAKIATATTAIGAIQNLVGRK